MRSDTGTHWTDRPEDKIYTVRINPADSPDVVDKLESLRGAERKQFIVSAFNNALGLPITKESELLNLFKTQQTKLDRILGMLERGLLVAAPAPIIETEEDEDDLEYLKQIQASRKREG